MADCLISGNQNQNHDTYNLKDHEDTFKSEFQSILAKSQFINHSNKSRLGFWSITTWKLIYESALNLSDPNSVQMSSTPQHNQDARKPWVPPLPSINATTATIVSAVSKGCACIDQCSKFKSEFQSM